MKKSGFAILSIFTAVLFLLLVHTSHSRSSKGYTSLAVEPYTDRVFAVHDEDDGVVVFDVKTGAIIQTILADKEIKAIAVDEEKKLLAAAGERHLYIVSTQTLETIKSVPISEEPTALAVDSRSGRALITHEHGRVSVVDINTGEIVTEIDVLKKPVSVAVDPELHIAVLAHRTEGDDGEDLDHSSSGRSHDNVTIIDLATLTSSKTLQAGKNPRHVAVNPVTHQAVVANEKSNDLTVVDLNTKSITGAVSLPKHPKAPSYNTCLNTLAVIGGEDRPWLQVLDAGTWGTKTSYTFERKLNDVTVHPSLNKAAIAGESGLIIQDLPNPTPELTSLTPDHALRGGAALSLTLAGKGLLSSTEIYLNGNKTDAVFQSCGSINITIPDTYLQKAGKVGIKAVNPTPEGGESNLLYFNVDNPVPVITLLQPSQASAGEAGIALNVIGAGFFNDTSIYVNGFQRAFTLLGQNQVQIALTTADLEKGGYLDITASNPQPGGGVSALARFTVLNPAPTLSSIDPTAIPANSADTTIILTGDNFVRSSQVVFNNQTYTTLFVNKTRIEATIPAQALTNSGTYSIKVVNPAPGGGETTSLSVIISQRNPNVEPLPDGSFGKQYEELIPSDATIQAYTPKRFAVVTGLVTDRNLNPIPDVKVSFLGLPEYGTSHTDADGRFNLPVDGGGAITVVFEKAGLITSHRQVNTLWNDIINTETITMLSEDPKGTTITFDGNPNTVLVHTSSAVTDSFGGRSLTMVFTGDNRATVTDANGNQTVMATITTRATEFDTPESMPAKLPPTSAYTYCSELTVDGAKNVKFDKPVTVYVDNFLGFKVGEIVPAGYYDRQKGVWMASDNGVVVRLLDTNGDGVVDALDTVGDGLPHDTNVAGLTDPTKFKPGSTYWRVKVNHFTSFDFNWPWGIPPDAIPPNLESPPVPDQQKKPDDIDCTGSYCERRSRVFHEDIPIPGMDMTLHYASNRVKGYKTVVTIPAGGGYVPGSLTKIIVRMKVAGRIFQAILPPLPNQQAEFAWDGLDYLGKTVIGPRTAEISIGFGYMAVYYTAESAFDQAWEHAGVPATHGLPSRQEILLWKYDTLTLNGKAPSPLVDGWALSAHHYLTPLDTNTLFKGDGTSIENSAKIITTVAGNGQAIFGGDNGPAAQASLMPYGVAVDHAGNIYIADYGNYRIRKVDTSGVITTVAGNGQDGFSGDGGPAVQAKIGAPTSVAVDNAGNIYIADYGNYRIRKVDTSGVITTVAGNGQGDYYSGDNGPAVQASLKQPIGVAVDNAGNVYIANLGTYRIRKVDTSGIITTIAGNGSPQYNGDNIPATQAGVSPYGVSVDNAGNIYIVDMGNSRIRKLDTSGIITTIAGNGSPLYNNGDNIPATQAGIFPYGVAVDNTGNIYIADTYNDYGSNANRVRKVNTGGIITTIAGKMQRGFSGDGGPAVQASLSFPYGVAVDSGGNIIYIADMYNFRIRKVSLPGMLAQYGATGDIPYFDENGLGYIMSSTGLHKSTIDLATGKALLTFGYDTSNQLVSITDRFGNRTTIQRDGNRAPTSITSPDGQVTSLTIDGNNHLTRIVNSDGSSYTFNYTPDGLMTDEYDRRNSHYIHRYDSNGRVTDIFDPEGGNWTYSRRADNSGTGNVFSNVLTGENNLIAYQDKTDSTGAYTSIKTDPAGAVTTSTRSSDGLTETIASPCGMRENRQYDLDTAYKFKYLTGSTTMSPAGLTRTVSFSKAYQDTNADGKPDIITDTMMRNGKMWTATDNTLTGSITAASPLGRTVTAAYDTENLLTQRIAGPGLYPTSYIYDTRGRLVSTTTGSRTTTVAYDNNGYYDYIMTPDNRKFDYTFDIMGRLKSVQQPNGSLIRYDYDLNGNMTALTNPKNITNTFGYTGNNQRKTWGTPLSGSYLYAYDKEKKLKTVTFPSGKMISNTYTQGLLTSTTTTEGVTGYSYGCSNLLSGATRGGEGLSFTYDGTLLKTDTRSGTLSQTISYTYNNDFNLSSITYAGTTQNLGYDNDSLMTSAAPYTITRNAQNGFPETVGDGKLKLTRVFNGYGEIDENTYAVNSTPLYDWTVTRDNGGRIIQKVDNLNGATAVWNYAYDNLGRLTEAKKNSFVVESYSYDANGNRTLETNTLRNISNKPSSYSPEDHVLTAGADTYQFDSDGFLTAKLTSAGTTTFNYSSRGELHSAAYPNGSVVTYDHDPMGRRIAKRVNGTTIEKYLWQGMTRLLAVYDGSNNLVMRFTYADGRMPVSMTTGGVTYYLFYDQIGSLRAVVDGSGIVVKEVLYDSFGSIIYENNPALAIPLGFAGGLHDRDTGLVRFGARDYDPAIGRWTAKDPIDFDGGDVNLMAYVGNNPPRFIDPLGLATLPGDPSGLPPNWTPDPSHLDPNGQKFVDPSGRPLYWHPGQPGKPGWGGKPHWHDPCNFGKKHLSPGTNIPDPAPLPPPVPWWKMLPALIPDPFTIIINPCILNPYGPGCYDGSA